MGPRTFVFVMLLGAICVSQALKCNFCKKIDKDNPTCDEMEQKDCIGDQNNCIAITLHEPAYGEIRRCATDQECRAAVPPQVELSCCDTDLCN